MTDPEIMWDWLRAYKVPFYETFWSILGMKEYQFIYHKTVLQELKDILMCAGVAIDSEDALMETKASIKKMCSQASFHFSQQYFNTATTVGVLRMMLKDLSQEYGVVFPIPPKDESESRTPWWAE